MLLINGGFLFYVLSVRHVAPSHPSMKTKNQHEISRAILESPDQKHATENKWFALDGMRSPNGEFSGTFPMTSQLLNASALLEESVCASVIIVPYFTQIFNWSPILWSRRVKRVPLILTNLTPHLQLSLLHQ